MRLKALLAAIGIVVAFGSCTTYTKTIREPNAYVRFKKDDFVFSNQVGGKAREVKVIGIDWRRFFKKSEGEVKPNKVGIPIIGNNITTSKPASYALYNMLSDHPGYDVVFYPQYNAKVSKPVLGLGFIVKITDMNIKARLGKITPTEGHTDENEEE